MCCHQEQHSSILLLSPGQLYKLPENPRDNTYSVYSIVKWLKEHPSTSTSIVAEHNGKRHRHCQHIHNRVVAAERPQCRRLEATEAVGRTQAINHTLDPSTTHNRTSVPPSHGIPNSTMAHAGGRTDGMYTTIADVARRVWPPRRQRCHNTGWIPNATICNTSQDGRPQEDHIHRKGKRGSATQSHTHCCRSESILPRRNRTRPCGIQNTTKHTSDDCASGSTHFHPKKATTHITSSTTNTSHSTTEDNTSGQWRTAHYQRHPDSVNRYRIQPLPQPHHNEPNVTLAPFAALATYTNQPPPQRVQQIVHATKQIQNRRSTAHTIDFSPVIDITREARNIVNSTGNTSTDSTALARQMPNVGQLPAIALGATSAILQQQVEKPINNPTATSHRNDPYITHAGKTNEYGYVAHPRQGCIKKRLNIIQNESTPDEWQTGTTTGAQPNYKATWTRNDTHITRTRDPVPTNQCERQRHMGTMGCSRDNTTRKLARDEPGKGWN